MAYDENERMNAERKEADNGPAEMVDQRDTEFAVDSWMGAVFNPDSNNVKRNIDYDPLTRTERYNGEQQNANLDGDLTQAREETEHPHYTVERSAKDYQTETAAEIAEPIRGTRRSAETKADPENGASGLGMTGLGLSILSLFLLPYLIAPVGFVLGYLAYRRDARTLGTWAMIIGVVAVLGALIVYPYYVAR
ncbi:MFS transporter [Brevibacillus borstelensis]|jgi:hypothetical protein|uniref:DUF456 domain-containing protein n=1 Tax=Brevibacillus borstelensis AK1 TaxID=1300222 RepID=M8DFC6_9BACL|nr:DUF456 domain-containing protein [Brevibacillus borstelensis]EMT52168.1 hypothetical protein I532_15033 [Brevibacillus borstelensis AK1]MBE5394083.1 DUF456 domain-containing protein [Brevibacillus borstelensis]MED1745000.1 DUF456 domain-containing protein [Brevibacillus borstelensis]MED1873126.1 DUF456 domain-containing protein [Brevibacillus borstelensis]